MGNPNTGYPWGGFWAYAVASYDFNESTGAIIATGYNGVYAINWANGDILWHFNVSAVPFEEPYNELPFWSAVKIADGKVYAYTTEHSPSQPITRGWYLFCLNVTTGQQIWAINGYMTPGAIADGYLVASNAYNGYTYVFGKGESATTVNAPDIGVQVGTEVTIRGTVMDMSPGDQGSTTNPTARLDSTTKPGTVPCVNAASMETQMEYLYMQFPIDGLYHNETITGVPVTLTATDSNGTLYNLGTVITNGYYGTYSIGWAPPNAGSYTITATFAGDDSYGSSSAATNMIATAVTATTSPTPTPTPTPTTTTSNAVTANDVMLYIVAAAIAIIIVIIIVGLLILRAFKKRP